jgi:hypothetical protein
MRDRFAYAIPSDGERNFIFSTRKGIYRQPWESVTGTSGQRMHVDLDIKLPPDTVLDVVSFDFIFFFILFFQYTAYG